MAGIIIVAPALWLAGRWLAGGDKARFVDSIAIVALGTVIGALVYTYIGGILAAIIMFFVWWGLIKHFFDCGWWKAAAIAIIGVIIWIVLIIILAIILGFGAWILWSL